MNHEQASEHSLGAIHGFLRKKGCNIFYDLQMLERSHGLKQKKPRYRNEHDLCLYPLNQK